MGLQILAKRLAGKSQIQGYRKIFSEGFCFVNQSTSPSVDRFDIAHLRPKMQDEKFFQNFFKNEISQRRKNFLGECFFCPTVFDRRT